MASLINLFRFSFDRQHRSASILRWCKHNYINGNIDEFAIWSGTDLRANASTIYNSGVPNDLNNNGLTAPTTWYRMGDAATIDGNDITIPDQIGSYNLTSEGMVAADVQSDVPS